MPWPCFLVEHYNDPRATKPGAMWPSATSNGQTYILRLPGGGLWNVFSKGSAGTGWNITGEAPNFTASPSINCHPLLNEDGSVWREGWHGWLQNGTLSDDCEGRTHYKEWDDYAGYN